MPKWARWLRSCAMPSQKVITGKQKKRERARTSPTDREIRVHSFISLIHLAGRDIHLAWAIQPARSGRVHPCRSRRERDLAIRLMVSDRGAVRAEERISDPLPQVIRTHLSHAIWLRRSAKCISLARSASYNLQVRYRRQCLARQTGKTADSTNDGH